MADNSEEIDRIAEIGTTLYLVEQNTRLALKYSKRAYVLRTGEIAMSGPSKDLANNEEPLKLLVQAIEQAGFTPGTDIAIALDPASSEVFSDGAYVLEGEGRTLSLSLIHISEPTRPY
mgnify:CR=1 FL=1